jgi:hypothetical protein
VTFAPTIVGSPSAVWTTALSWMQDPSPTRIRSKSPRSTAPNQTLVSGPSTTSPMSVAVGATNASAAMSGSLPSNAWIAISAP